MCWSLYHLSEDKCLTFDFCGIALLTSNGVYHSFSDGFLHSGRHVDVSVLDIVDLQKNIEIPKMTKLFTITIKFQLINDRYDSF